MRPLALLAALLVAASAAHAQTPEQHVGFGFTYRVGDETVILAVAPDGPAARAGLQPGDRLVAVNGQATAGRTPDAVAALLAEAKEHGSAALRLARGGAERTLAVTPGPFDADALIEADREARRRAAQSIDWSAAFEGTAAYLDSLDAAAFDANLAFLSGQIRTHHPWRSGLAFDAAAGVLRMEDELVGTVRYPVDRMEVLEEDTLAALRCADGSECIRVEGHFGGFTTARYAIVLVEGATGPQPVIAEIARRLRSVLRHAGRTAGDHAEANAPPPARLTVSFCHLDGAVLVDGRLLYDPESGDYVLPDGTFLRRAGESFPASVYARGRYAALTPWYINNEVVTIRGRRYVKYGLPRILAVSEVALYDEYQGAAFFVEAGAAGVPEVLYAASNPECEFQPYQLEVEDGFPAPSASLAEQARFLLREAQTGFEAIKGEPAHSYNWRAQFTASVAGYEPRTPLIDESTGYPVYRMRIAQGPEAEMHALLGRLREELAASLSGFRFRAFDGSPGGALAECEDRRKGRLVSLQITGPRSSQADPGPYHLSFNVLRLTRDVCAAGL